MSARVGNDVIRRPAGSNTSASSRFRYDWPATASAMSATTMLSVFEYSYRDPGANSSGSARTQSMIPVGATNPVGSFVASSTNASECR